MNGLSVFPVLDWLLDATLKGSVLIVLIALVQRLIARRVDAKWRHALWLIVLLRLALPAAPSSDWSLFNLLPAHSTIPLRIHVETAPPLEIASLRTIETMDVIPPIARIGGWRWLAALWIVGVIALLLRALIATFRVHIALKREALHSGTTLDVVEDAKRRLGIRRDVRVVETGIVKAPALHGLFRPTLLLPPGLAASFSRDELRHVVLHELWHLRRLDVAVSWVLAVVQALHWFNPFVWFAVSRIQEERELACDELALSCLEEDERSGYGRTILKLLERFRAAAPVPALVGIVNHKQKMKRRLTMIATFRNRSRFSILFVAAIAVIGAMGLTDARDVKRHVLRTIDPAGAATMERLDQRISFDLTNASFSDLLNTVANKTGVAVTQTPEIATSVAQQARFTLHVENVPAHAVLMEALMPFKLAPEPDANGVAIATGPSCGIMTREDVAENGATGTIEKKVERRVVTNGESIATDDADIPTGPGEKRVEIRAEGPAECKLNADGSLHRELTLNMDENGVKSQGKLVIDIAGAKATK
jgi:beta-lactamase regulating signal transducer with metallopeptidase domain